MENRKYGIYIDICSNRKYIIGNMIYRGYVNKYEDLMKEMDIAISPSISGRGMQQKIFEPLARGIPTISSDKGMQGYQFEDGKHILLAKKTWMLYCLA